MRWGIAALVVLVVAGCGGGGGKKVPTTTQTPEGIAQIQQALRGVHSYHLGLSGEGTTISADWDAGAVRVHIDQASGSNDAIITPRATYVRGDARFWRHANLAPAIADRVAGRWVQVPLDPDTAAFVKRIDPRSLAYCAGVDVGTTRDLGTRTRNGVKVHVLEFAGDVPGSSPGTVEYAADGPAYPLRLEQTGKRKPGGTTDSRCSQGETSAGATHAVTEFSHFNDPIKVEAPAKALTLDDVKAMSQGGGTTA